MKGKKVRTRKGFQLPDLNLQLLLLLKTLFGGVCLLKARTSRRLHKQTDELCRMNKYVSDTNTILQEFEV